MKKIKILLVDDDYAILNTLKLSFDFIDAYEVVGEAYNGKEAIEIVGDLMPDIVIMDLHMPEMDGAEATKIITQRYNPYVKVIAFTSSDEIESVQRMIEAGAHGYILKSSLGTDLEVQLEKVLKGRFTYTSNISSKLNFGKGN